MSFKETYGMTLDEFYVRYGNHLGDKLAQAWASYVITNHLPCGCTGQCDPYAHDTAPFWDGTPDGPYYTRCPECDCKIYEGEDGCPDCRQPNQ